MVVDDLFRLMDKKQAYDECQAAAFIIILLLPAGLPLRVLILWGKVVMLRYRSVFVLLLYGEGVILFIEKE